VDVTVTVIGIGIDELILEYRKVTQDTCPHDTKVKMAGFKDRYECTRCHKFIIDVPSDKKTVIA
jgi:ribosomal protein S27AE